MGLKASPTQHSLATATRILEVCLSPTRHLENQAIAQFENAKATEFANRRANRAHPHQAERPKSNDFDGKKWRARNDSNVRPSDS